MKGRLVLRMVVVTTAVGLIGVTTALVLQPALLPTELADAIEARGVDPTHLGYVVAGILAGYGLWLLVSDTPTPPGGEGPTDSFTSDDEQSQNDRRVIGKQLTDSVAEARRSRRQRGDQYVERVQRSLAAALRDLETAHGIPPDEVDRRIEDGDWTADPHAAQFLGASSVRVPLHARVLGWLFPDIMFERELERSISELEAHVERLREGNGDA